MNSGTPRSSDDKYYRALFENSTDVVLLTVPDGTIVAANPVACRMFGMSKKEICDAGREGLIDHTDPNHQKFLEELKTTGKAGGELIYRRKDGSKIIGAATSVIFEGGARAFVIIRDITQEKKAEKALRESEAKYRCIVDTANEGIWMIGPDTLTTSVNTRMAEMLGVTPEEMIGHPVTDFMFEEDVPDHLKKMENRRKGMLEHYERRYRHKDGQTVWTLASATPIFDAEHLFKGSFAMFTDITERKRAEQERRKSEEKFSIIFQATPDLIAITRASDGTILEVNEAFTRLLGYSRAEAIGKSTKELSIWADPADRARWMAALEATGQVNEFETTLRCRDGSLITCVSTARPLDFGGEKCVLSVVRDITQRKRSEEELQLTQFCVDKASLALYQLTEEGDIWNVNECACQSLGYSMEELRSMTVFDIDPDCAREVFNDLATKLFDCGSITFERVHRRKDGTTFPVEITSNAVEFRGRMFGINFVKDITERKRAEQEIARLASFPMLNPQPITEVDLDGRVSFVNPAARLLFPDLELQESRHPWLADWEQLVSFCRDKGTNPDDREVAVAGHWYYQCMHYVSQDKRLRIYGIDITTRKLAEKALRLAHDELEKRVAERTEQLQKTAEELRESEERFALAIQASNDGIWDLNLETGEAYRSPRWKSILGYEGDEISGNFKEWESRVHPDDLQRVMNAGKACEEGRIPEFVQEYRLRHKDGSDRWVFNRGACLRDSHGKPYRMVGAITDITERKKLEQQLLLSQKMESIGVLAGGVAHDFNNLLTAISGYGQILLETIPEDDELSLDNIRNVLKAADRAAELTRGLLAFSRKQTINPKPVHIDSLIGNAGKLIQRIIGEDIEFGSNFPDKNLLVMADAGQIEQVLMNLATNSRDAMPDGGHLCITARQAIVEDGSEKLFDLLSPGKYALISVSDTGIGIEKESLGKVFEPFYTTKGVGEGTGLGLSMVHGIIKQHNGSVLVDSEPGKGTQVDIYLPLIEGHAEVEKSKPVAPPAAGKETVLFVEDEEIVRVFMQKMLERAGYRVIVADNGEDGVERFRENADISLVLSDMVMPRKNGRQMLDEIRRMKPGTKAVFMSGYTADIMQDKGMLDDVTEFITKPVKKDDLLRKMRELLDKD